MKYLALLFWMVVLGLNAQTTNVPTGQQIGTGTNMTQVPYSGGGGGGGVTAIDTFIRANADPVSNPMSDLSSTWASPIGNWQQAQIIGNKLVGHTSSGFHALARVATPTFSSNQTNSYTVDSTLSGGPAVRLSSNGSGYALFCFSSTRLAIYTLDGSTSPPTEQYIYFNDVSSGTIASGDIITLYVVGTTLTGTWTHGITTEVVTSGTDSTYSTGQPGEIVADSAGTTLINITSP